MAQRENHFRSENKYDRKKESKYDIGDLIEVRYGTNKKDLSATINIVIIEKYALEDKQGRYWVYDIFYPHNSHMEYKVRLAQGAGTLFPARTFKKVG